MSDVSFPNITVIYDENIEESSSSLPYLMTSSKLRRLRCIK